MDRRTEWRDGWPTVLAAFLGVAASAMPSFTLGVMMKPLSEGYGWSRAEITSMITIVTVFMLTLSPVIGGLVDRYGARRLVLIACFIFALGFASLSLAGPAIWGWYVASAFLGIGMAMAGATVWISAVARQFSRRRAFALSVALSGLGLSLAATPALATAALGLVGFRHVYFLLAGIAFLCCFPTGLLFFHDRRQEAASPAPFPASAPEEPGLRFTQALATTRFWRLALSMLIVAGCSSTLLIHYVPIMTDRGISPARAAAYLTLLGPASIAGRLVCGALMDRLFAPWVTAAAFSLALVGYLLLLGYDGSPAMSLIIPCLVGFAGGAEVDVAAYLTARYFGLRSFGALYGLVQGCNAIFYGFAPMIAALLFDRTGSYAGMLSVLAGALVVSVLLVATLGRYPDYGTDAPAHDDLQSGGFATDSTPTLVG